MREHRLDSLLRVVRRFGWLARFCAVSLLGLIDSTWFFFAEQIDRAWALEPGSLLALTFHVRFCLWSAAAFIAIVGQGPSHER